MRDAPLRKKTQIHTTPANRRMQRCAVLSVVQLCSLPIHVYLHTATLATVPKSSNGNKKTGFGLCFFPSAYKLTF